MGSRTIGSLIVKLGFDPKEVDKGLKTFEKNLKDAGRRMESIGRTMSIGFTAPFLLGMRQAIKAYDEEAVAVRKLEVALGRTSSALLTQAAAIQKTTTFADDAVINVQAYAAALGHSEEETKKMTSAAVNLAAGLGISLDSAMEMLHKSTLGAAKGLGNLLPGVKDLTKEQLKAGAAIDMVNQRFAGYAETLAKTGAGPLKQFENRFGDLMEQFGEAALPLLNKIIDKFTALTEWFEKLSPETKELVIEVGALVALSGPVLLMAGNVIKLASAFKTLGLSMGFLTNPYVAAVLLALAAGEGLDDAIYKDEKGNRIIKTDKGGRKYTQSFGSEVALGVEGRQYIEGEKRSALFGQFPDLIPGFGMTFPKNETTTNNTDDTEDEIKDLTKAVNDYSSAIQRALTWQSKMLTPNRGNPAAGMSSIAPNLSPAVAGGVGGGLPTLTGVGGHGQAIADMMAIQPDLTSQIEGHERSVKALTDGYMTLGNTIAGVMTSVADALIAGGDAWAAFGKAALLAGAQTVKAMLAATLAKAIAHEAGTKGVAGIILGATLGMAAIGIVEGLIGKMKTPKLAQGGLAYGPTMAVVGDNPNANVDPEVISPLSKLKGMMTGGANVQLSGIIRGNDIHLVTSREQGFAARRGSGNLITF